jgi:DNA-binding NarL/FixJ family response regulator
VRVVIGEDSVLLREGIVRLLGEAGIEVVGQAGDAEDLVRKVSGHKPDVAIIDIRMPPDHSDEGLRAAREIRAAFPDVGILVLSQYVDEHYAVSLLSEGAEGIGYLLKDRVSEVDRFVDAVRRVGAGGSVLDPEVVANMLGRRRDEDELASLSPREREVLKLMAQGLSNRAICEQMFVTERAVEHHITSIFQKLGLSASGNEHRRVVAVLTYLQN